MSRRGQESTRHAMADRGLDQYFTPPEAVRALMAIEPLPDRLWEPACGTGNITEVLKLAGRSVFSSDVELQGCLYSVRLDFLSDEAVQTAAGLDTQAIVTNPPFDRLPDGWVERCLEFAPDVYLLARLQFLEGSSPWRRQVLEKSGLRRVYVFRDRLPMMHRQGWTGPRAASRMAFAWFCWRRGWRGQASIRRISWKDPGPALPPPGVKLPKTYCRSTPDMFKEATR